MTTYRSKKNKYGVAPKSQRTLDGKLYASKKEKNYRIILEKLKTAVAPNERVVDIQEQVNYILEVNGVKICAYRLDFKVTYADGRIEHIDCKGMTKGTSYTMFKYKQRLMLALHGITVIEV